MTNLFSILQVCCEALEDFDNLSLDRLVEHGVGERSNENHNEIILALDRQRRQFRTVVIKRTIERLNRNTAYRIFVQTPLGFFYLFFRIFFNFKKLTLRASMEVGI